MWGTIPGPQLWSCSHSPQQLCPKHQCSQWLHGCWTASAWRDAPTSSLSCTRPPSAPCWPWWRPGQSIQTVVTPWCGRQHWSGRTKVSLAWFCPHERQDWANCAGLIYPKYRLQTWETFQILSHSSSCTTQLDILLWPVESKVRKKFLFEIKLALKHNLLISKVEPILFLPSFSFLMLSSILLNMWVFPHSYL